MADAPPAASGGAAVAYKPTLYTFRDPALIPRRDFIYGRHLIRQYLSATVAPSGVIRRGKLTP